MIIPRRRRMNSPKRFEKPFLFSFWSGVGDFPGRGTFPEESFFTGFLFL
jgi:hypothetical protein